ncbi:hypothetical protein E1B28_000521 [Marasmius oreades]|uniref:PHD-type domain-containing protein n=1 Tax=Marasmius oreades TaxID=181124 RepID=A0A9P7V1K9_9AGAR|nr:uncharacterized protein E1B28_000521 [Marasmius oreades]KAG7098596.1 hypothetical protein E1B28_000521 [Marasmius oreades]
MTQTSSMGPPLSPREIRRSGRRSAPSVSTSNSKSPDSDPPQRPPIVSSGSGGSRNKRLKQEDVDESVVSVNSNPTSNGRGKRRSKEKPAQHQQPPEQVTDTVVTDLPVTQSEEEEEQGITRCVCSSTGEDDPDAGEFMVQCETCKVWQHGLCMGFESEDQLHDDDYYCEQCRPELHTELLKKLSKRARQSSTTSHHTAVPTSSTTFRSHSPTHTSKQPSKRRNTMNSRDAAFDENLKEILESSAAEAGTGLETASLVSNNGNALTSPPDAEDSVETAPNNRKKRKRADNDPAPVKKRTRSMSTASDHPAAVPSLTPREETPTLPKAPTTNTTMQKPPGRNKRGGRKAATTIEPAVDGEGVPIQTSKRQGNGGRNKNVGGNKRPPQSTAGVGSHDSRRGQANTNSNQNAGSNATDNSRAHRNTHAYVVSQQPLFTSWNLPDYLAHLEAVLPTNVPKPLEVVSGITGRGESIERTTERGVKVKWPSKRMSVVDMNKRVRALVEWVGREQASASERARRREFLENALKENALLDKEAETSGAGSDTMVLDSGPRSASPSAIQSCHEDVLLSGGESEHTSLMKDMEKLMTDLITFQERFGPGVKARDRERRHAS